MSKAMFILFDGTAKIGTSDSASILDTAETEAEARESGIEDWAGFDAIWYECELLGDRNIGPGVPRWDLPPASDKKKRRRRRRKAS